MSLAPVSAELFRDELRELLAELDAALLEVETSPDASEALGRVFRAMHTIKGACDMFGLGGAVTVLHDMESLWDRVRSGRLSASRELVDVTLAVKDWIAPVVDSGQDPQPDLAMVEAMTRLADAAQDQAQDQAQTRTEPADRPSAAAPSGPPPDGDDCPRAYRVRLAPSDPGVLALADPAALLDSLAELGPMDVRLDASAVPDLKALALADCLLRWEILLTTSAGQDAVRDVFLFLENPRDVSIEDLGPAAPLPENSPAAASSLAGPARPASPASGAWGGGPAPPARNQACPPAQAQQPPQAQAAKPTLSQTLRVETSKLDNLVNLVGELVIAQARLSQVSQGLGHSELTGVAEEIERLVVELRDNTLGIRMLPIGTTFSRFRRLVRDLSSELGKEIELLAEGGETELDKTVIEQLGDPLVHLLRNSIDHGIEPPAQRAEAGKPPRGLIRLVAKQAGGAVIIRIEDDGRGLDPARIKAKAVERGVISQDARLSTQEVFQLIFAPGFSTAERVTNVSGRGVGMDVVKRSIESLRGSVDIESAPGRGTAIVVTLPLTLAIIDGLQVRAAGELYIIPLSMVEECVELDREKAGPRNDSRTLSVRGEIVPYLRLRETFELKGAPPRVEQVVVTRHENGRTGIAVDEVVGQQQTVIKNLGRLIGRVEGISGATINGDGTMALILDVPQLVDSIERDGMQ